MIKQKRPGAKANLLSVLILTVSLAVMLAVTIIENSVIKKTVFATRAVLCYGGIGLLYFSMLFAMYLYIRHFYTDMVRNTKLIATLYTIVVICFTCCVFITQLSVFAMPVTMAAMLACVFFDSRLGFVANTFTALFVFVAIGSPSMFGSATLDTGLVTMLIVALVIGTLLSFVIARDTRRLHYIFYGIGLNLLSLPIVAFVEMLDTSFLVGYAKQLPFLAFLIFGSVIFSFLLQPLLESVFNVNSNFRLIELTNHRQPLLKRLSEDAPGTFNHSLTVANLAETCANAIGENMYLTRAAAYYHDVGKLKTPMFFKENQPTDDNMHDELTPEASTDIIRKHTTNGEQICKEYRIPKEIADITREHHGTTVIAYFYHKAKQLTDGREPDIKDFSYPGPTPATKIAAIIMICDSCEAAIRSMDKPTSQEVDKLVGSIIRGRLDSGQFDNCPITMQDLYDIRKTIVNAVCGLYHQRIKYPT